jgi:hypothetical protein
MMRILVCMTDDLPMWRGSHRYVSSHADAGSVGRQSGDEGIEGILKEGWLGPASSIYSGFHESKGNIK